MAQKTTSSRTPLGVSGKPEKVSLGLDNVNAAELDIPRQTTQPARREYPEVKAAIEQGLADVAAGRVHTRRSYAEYADIEIED